MQKIPQTQLLARLETAIERQCQIITSRFQNMEQDILLRPAAEGGWSIAQCFGHLNSYGRYYLPEIERALSVSDKSSNASLIFKGSWLGSYFTRMMQPGGNSRKYKAPKDHMPAANLDAAEVLACFIAQQEQLLLQVRAAAGADLDKIRVPISISRWIRLKLGDVFQFLIAHNERHIQQALRCLPAN